MLQVITRKRAAKKGQDIAYKSIKERNITIGLLGLILGIIISNLIFDLQVS
jgi:hypothetical protein